jgi:acetyl-CoA C-acetyltransferase
MKPLRKVAVIGGVRIPFVKSFKEYSRISNQEMLTATVQATVNRYKMNGKLIGDVALGAILTFPSDWNLAREVVLGTDLDHRTPGFNLQRACGTSLEAVNLLALKIAAGQIESGIAGGSDTKIYITVTGPRSLGWKLIDLQNAKSFGDRVGKFLRLRPADLKPVIPGIREPRTGKTMGEHTEIMVKQWKISREAQDELAYLSHMNAAKAYKEGFYDDMITQFKGVKTDTIVRPDTTMEKLSKLRTAFDKSPAGSLTAGNSTIFTDGAASVLLASEEFASKNNLEVQAYFVDGEAAAVDHVHGAGLLMAPTLAVARLLKRNNLTLQDFDFYEIHEAFAGQVLCTLKAWESDDYCRTDLGLDKALGSIDRSKLNVKGGSVAIGHPFGATGTRVTMNLAKLLAQKGKGRGLLSVCTAGGMGVTAILER